MKWIILFLILILVGVGCSRPCDPDFFWSCLDNKVSQYSCSALTNKSQSGWTAEIEQCKNQLLHNLSYSEQTNCKNKVADDLQKNLRVRMTGIMDRIFRQCGL